MSLISSRIFFAGTPTNRRSGTSTNCSCGFQDCGVEAARSLHLFPTIKCKKNIFDNDLHVILMTLRVLPVWLCFHTCPDFRAPYAFTLLFLMTLQRRHQTTICALTVRQRSHRPSPPQSEKKGHGPGPIFTISIRFDILTLFWKRFEAKDEGPSTHAAEYQSNPRLEPTWRRNLIPFLALSQWSLANLAVTC